MLLTQCNALLSILDVNCGLSRVCADFGYVRPTINACSALSSFSFSRSLHAFAHRCSPSRRGRHDDEAEAGQNVHPQLSPHGLFSLSFFLVLLVGQQGIRSCIITGPNMGGKTTLLRSVALCVILGQMGCFIPASRGEIGTVDKIFSRVGSSDDILNNRSTFYSEISETASILRNGFVIVVC